MDHSSNTMAITQENQEQREGEDILTAAQILLDQLSGPVSDPTLPQTNSAPSVSLSSLHQPFDDRRMASITYSEGSNQSNTITQTAETTVTSSNRFVTSSPSRAVFQNTTGSENSSQKQTDTIQAEEAAQILINLHHEDYSRARIPVDLLSVPGRSGLRSRGVFIRRQGVPPVDERLSTEQDTWEEEDEKYQEEDIKEEEGGEFDDEDDEEYQAAARRARRPVVRRSEQDRKGEGKKERKSRRKHPHGAPGDYQRHSVRDGKGRFIKRSE